MNHQDLPENEVATQLWFDQHLKKSFSWPKTPSGLLKVNAETKVPFFNVRPDTSHPIKRVDVYYTQQGIEGGDRSIRENRIARFWHHAQAAEIQGNWAADLPLSTTDKPVWVYANVEYALEQPVSGAGYYYGVYTTDHFNLSTLIQITQAKDLQILGVKSTLKPSQLIESFEGDWKKEWFTTKPADWGRKTHKVYHPLWAAPQGASLALDVRTELANKLVLGIDKHAAEVELTGGSDWQTIHLTSADFKDAEEVSRTDWAGIKEFRFAAAEHLRGGKRGRQQAASSGGGMERETASISKSTLGSESV